jgi:hypothetical protein
MSSKLEIDTTVYRGIRQFSILLDNKHKTIESLLAGIRTHRITPVAFSSVETQDYVVLRLISNYSENLKKILLADEVPFFENDVLGVEFFHSDDVFKVVSAISTYEIKIHYMYPIMSQHGNKIGMILRVEDLNLAAKAVHSAGISTITQENIDR